MRRPKLTGPTTDLFHDGDLGYACAGKQGGRRVWTKDGILELEQRHFKAMCDGDADALGALLHDGLPKADIG